MKVLGTTLRSSLREGALSLGAVLVGVALGRGLLVVLEGWECRLGGGRRSSLAGVSRRGLARKSRLGGGSGIGEGRRLSGKSGLADFCLGAFPHIEVRQCLIVEDTCQLSLCSHVRINIVGPDKQHK